MSGENALFFVGFSAEALGAIVGDKLRGRVGSRPRRDGETPF